MKRSLFAVALLSAAMLAACETATPYQPLGAPGSQASGGYFDHQIEGNRWQVGFKGNDLTSRETVERYLLYRAAELTVSQGYDWFEATERHTDKKTDTYANPDPYYAGWGGYWGPRWAFIVAATVGVTALGATVLGSKVLWTIIRSTNSKRPLRSFLGMGKSQPIGKLSTPIRCWSILLARYSGQKDNRRASRLCSAGSARRRRFRTPLQSRPWRQAGALGRAD